MKSSRERADRAGTQPRRGGGPSPAAWALYGLTALLAVGYLFRSSAAGTVLM